MAGSAFRLNPTHASCEPRLPGFRAGNLVEASVTMLGRTFTTAIREGATTNDLIEKVARENGGEVTKKYYSEFKTWEITSVRIGDAVLVKSSESGIHFSLGVAGIPMAVTEKQGIVFPNAEELRIGRNTRNIALWTTSANFDPGNIADIDRMYSSRGGAVLSKDARDEISKAHGGVRSGNGVLLEENILVLNKDTGEILTVSQHAAREPESIPFSAGPILASSASSSSVLPAAFADARPSQNEPMARYDPALFDAFRSRMNDASSLIIKTFDGSIADSVTVRFNPFSQDERGPALSSLPQAADAGASTSARPRNPANVPAQRLSFCLLAFSSIMPPAVSPDSAAGLANRRDAASILQVDGASPRKANPDIPDLRQKKAKPGRQEIPAAPSFESAYEAWKASRFSKARLDIPTGLSAPVKPGRRKAWGNSLGNAQDGLRRNIQATLDTAAKLLSIMALIRRLAKMTAQKAPIGPGAPLKNQKSNSNQLKDRLALGQRRKRSKVEKSNVPKPEVKTRVVPAYEARKTEAKKSVQPGFGLRAAKPKHAKPVRTLQVPVSLKTKSSRRQAAKEERLDYPKEFRARQTAPARAGASALGAGRKKKLPPYFLWEMLNLHWKKRGRKFRMKKNSAP